MTAPAYWLTRKDQPAFPQLDRNLRVDVCVIGGGITGVTAAYLLRKSGCSVALLERRQFGSVDTGHTTAHLTQVTDSRLSELVDDFGRDHARATWDAGRAAIEQIHENIHAENIDCHFAWLPGYLHAPTEKKTDAEEIGALKHDAALSVELGFDAEFLDSIPLLNAPGVRFPNQARFHPLKYLSGMLRSLSRDGAFLFENSEVSEVAESPLTVKANGREVSCNWVVIATHVPLMGKTGLLAATLFQSKLALYSTYAIAARAPIGAIADALYWDTADPYRYLRLDRLTQSDYLVYGGEDHKTGQDGAAKMAHERLETSLTHLVPSASVTYRWTGQVVETHDGLPYIGEITDRQFIATGFAGNGMTFGTLAAIMARDAVNGHKNPWKNLFDPHRKKLSGMWDYLKENVDYPYYMVRDRLLGAEGQSLNELKPCEGKLLRLGLQKVAAYRDAHGTVTTLSPVCTHMGCHVHWNMNNSTWDCPCHGSRFQPTGEVLGGPAESPLERVRIEKTEASAVKAN